MSLFLPVDIEAALVKYLTQIGSRRVITQVPNPRPQEFIRVQRVSGGPINLVQDQAMVLVEAYGPGSDYAWALASETWTSLLALDGEWITWQNGVWGRPVWCANVTASVPVRYDEPGTNQVRYQFTATFTIPLEVYNT